MPIWTAGRGIEAAISKFGPGVTRAPGSINIPHFPDRRFAGAFRPGFLSVAGGPSEDRFGGPSLMYTRYLGSSIWQSGTVLLARLPYNRGVTQMQEFHIRWGKGPNPEAAKDEAEAHAREFTKHHPTAEQISIAACVLPGSSDPDKDLLRNIADNIFQLVRCQCPGREVVVVQQNSDSVVETIKVVPAGVPPPVVFLPPPPSPPVFVVYILLRVP